MDDQNKMVWAKCLLYRFCHDMILSVNTELFLHESHRRRS